MNRKLYEAVPLDEWMKQPHETGYYTVMNGLDDKFMGQVYYSNSNIEFGNKSDCTHVLVAVEEVDKWISVKSGNPENIGLYEVFCNDGSHLMAHVNVVGWWTIPFGDFSGDMGPKFVRDSKEVEREVTHWKVRNPLPSAPKQDNNK